MIKTNKDSQEHKYAYKSSKNYKSSNTLPYHSANMRDKVSKKKGSGSRENSINNSKSFNYLSKHLYSNNHTNQRKLGQNNHASKVFNDISNKKLLLNIQEFKQPVTKKAKQLIHKQMSKYDEKQQQAQLKYNYAPYNYTHKVRNCQSQGKIFKKYDYLGGQRSCLRQIDYATPYEGKQHKWHRSQSTKVGLSNKAIHKSYLNIQNPEKLSHQRAQDTIINSKKYESLERSPYLDIKDQSISSINRQTVFHRTNKLEDKMKLKEYDRKPIITSQFKVSGYQPQLRIHKASEKYQNSKIREELRSFGGDWKNLKSKQNLCSMREYDRDLETSRIDKINQKLDEYIRHNIH